MWQGVADMTKVFGPKGFRGDNTSGGNLVKQWTGKYGHIPADNRCIFALNAWGANTQAIDVVAYWLADANCREALFTNNVGVMACNTAQHINEGTMTTLFASTLFYTEKP